MLRRFAKKLVDGYKKHLIKKKMEKLVEYPLLMQLINNFSQGSFDDLNKHFSYNKKKSKHEDENEIEFEGVTIPEFPHKLEIEIKKEIRKHVKLVYTLIPLNPKENEKIFAYAKIGWDPKMHMYIYKLFEPKLTARLGRILRKIKNEIEEKAEELTERPEEKIETLMDNVIRNFKFKLSKDERNVLLYYLKRDFLGFGKIDPLMKDPNIEDITCDAPKRPIFVVHSDPRLGSIMTNVVYDIPEELDSFVVRLAQMAGKSLNIAQPVVDGILPDGSRVQVSLTSDVAPKGSNFTIRKFSRKPLTPTHLLLSRTIDLKTLAFLWMCVHYGRNILIAGGTGTGKTTLLNILAGFIPPEKRIVTIEDTPELKLPHPHWVSHVARVPIARGDKPGEIDLFELLRESLRQRPDYVIVGEVRGTEASILFQQMATGHVGLSTIHSEDMVKLIDRLKTPPISLSPSLLEILDMVVFIKRIKYKGEFVRRINSINEIIKVDPDNMEVHWNEVISWDAHKDEFKIKNKSRVLKKISDYFGLREDIIKNEIIDRSKVLFWMVKKGITNFDDFYNIVKRYYADKDNLMNALEGELNELI